MVVQITLLASTLLTLYCSHSATPMCTAGSLHPPLSPPHPLQRSQDDEDLLGNALDTAPPNSELVIFDARSFIAAGGNRFKGKGTEHPQNYKRCRLVYLDIPNIHSVRDSMDRLHDVCLSPENNHWLSLVESTSWLNYISLILKVSVGGSAANVVNLPYSSSTSDPLCVC